MGILSKLFSKGPRYPFLDSKDPAARRVTKVLRPLESLVRSVPQGLELVPGTQRSFVFLGQPPNRFDFAWIQDGRIHSLHKLAAKGGVAPREIDDLSNELCRVYENSRQDKRYQVSVAGRQVVVTPSRQLQLDVEKVVHKVTSRASPSSRGGRVDESALRAGRGAQ